MIEVCRFKSVRKIEREMLVRSCKKGDSSDLFDWRNDPYTRQMSLNTDPVPRDVHESWFANRREDTNCSLYIGEVDGEKIGVVRFDYDPSRRRAEISINLNPLFRGKKMAYPFLLESIQAFRGKRSCPIFALVRIENIASRKVFEASGFNEVKIENGVCEFILT